MSASELVLHRGLGSGAIPCRSCQKPIVFAVMHSSGKKAPFQVDPHGEWSITNGIAKHIGNPPAQQDLLARGPQPTRYTSHFARCPAASQWRKRGED